MNIRDLNVAETESEFDAPALITPSIITSVNSCAVSLFALKPVVVHTEVRLCVFLSRPSGHLLSTAEVEAALTLHSAVSEAAVVSRPHQVKGESLYCFVTLKDSREFDKKMVVELKTLGEAQTQTRGYWWENVASRSN